MLKIKGIILKQALQGAGLKQEEAAKILEISRPTLSIWCNKAELTEEIIKAVKDKLQIDLTSKNNDSNNYIETGKGEKFIPNDKINAISSNQVNHPDHEPPSNYMEQVTKYLTQGRPSNDIVKITPVFNHHVTSGRVSLVKGNRAPDELHLDGGFKDCDLVMRHTDPAMNGFMHKNSYIGVQQISEDSYTDMIIPGKAYVIIFKNYVVERFLFPGTTKDLLLRSSDRDNHPDFEITFDKIVELWLIKVWSTVPELETV